VKEGDKGGHVGKGSKWMSEKQQDKGRDERRISRKIKKGRNRLEWKGGCEERERKIAKSKRELGGGRGGSQSSCFGHKNVLHKSCHFF